MHRFNSAEHLSKTLQRYERLYNQHLPQKALIHQTPLMALKRWQELHTYLFKKIFLNHPGPYTLVSKGEICGTLSDQIRGGPPVGDVFVAGFGTCLASSIPRKYAFRYFGTECDGRPHTFKR